MLHLPFSFADSGLKWFAPLKKAGLKKETVRSGSGSKASVLYDHMNLASLGLSETAYRTAVAGFEKLKQAGKIANTRILSIIDFTRSSAKKRLFVIDLETEQVLFNTYVAHGQNSGSEYANRFSNNPESFQSSLGFYETSDTYVGKNGYSMHLNGLERGINDKADTRSIVMHGAPYVSEQYIKTKGYIGRSWGCPAVPEKLNTQIINTIRNGSCLFIYANSNAYLKKSKVLNS
jgi:hypothetical protein